jgi:CubicO group peptidase (beta-lactamase class C family)
MQNSPSSTTDLVSSGFADDRIDRLRGIVDGHAARGDVPGAAWLVARGDDVRSGVAGTIEAGGTQPIARDTIFRISSMTKPVTAVAALVLVEECRLRLDDPVDDLLPELADRRVLADPFGPLDETVPARRPITLRDLLTFRLGHGMDFSAGQPQPVLQAYTELELGVGPPAPQVPPGFDEWMRRLGTLPLERQPGERWLYHTGAEVLGVLIERAAECTLETFMRQRIFEPLGMRDTGFSVDAQQRARFGPVYGNDPATGARTVYDAADGQWSGEPSFASGGAGLVSTVDDFHAFAAMLLGVGKGHGDLVLARPTVAAMVTNHLTRVQLTESAPEPSGATGWGFGVGVQVVRAGLRSTGSYGWDGGLGTSWVNDPHENLIGVLLTNQMFTSITPPAIVQDFWTASYAALRV